MKDRKVAVTGGDGFIGSHLCEALLTAGCHVKALAQYNSFGHYGWLDEVLIGEPEHLEIVLGDIRDPFFMAEFTKGQEIVFHLASLIAIPFSYRAPESYVETNIRGTLNVLQACKSAGVARLVHTSTSEVYGTAQAVPMTELHPLAAQSPYAATKIAADQLALSYYRTYNLPVTIVRPFNTFGPRQSARAIIPTIITQMLTDQKRIKLGAMHPTRDFTFVTDIARGLLAAAQSNRAIGEVINLGSGREISIGDLAIAIAEIMDRNATFTTDRQRLRPEASEVDRLLCDATKARKMLKWRPTVSLAEGLRETIEWFANPEILSRYRPDSYTI